MFKGKISMTIYEVCWKNFRAFSDTGWLAIKPVTIIVGGNNSGKSSILNPLLILKQTLESPRARSALVLRGDLANSGTFTDIVHGHDPTNKVTFAIRFNERARSSSEPPRLGVARPAVCELTFQSEDAPGLISLYRYSVLDTYDRVMMTRTRTSSRRYSLTEIQNWADDSDSGESASPSAEAAFNAIHRSAPYHFLFDAEPVFAAAIEATQQGSVSDEEREEATASFREPADLKLSGYATSYAAVVAFVEQHVTEGLSNVLYLGPLRDRPKRLYELSGDAPANVGVRGQFAPEILLRARKRTLFRQVNSWLKQFDFPGELACRQLTDTAFELSLAQGNQASTSFADVGFGYSQLLPLLVQGLSAESGTVLITEQPEIHLNPRLQTRLAEFIVHVATKREANVLVETHSEHLVLGIRRLVAEGRIRAEDVAVYFTESNVQGAIVRNVPIQDNGHVDAADWPAGFFEDSLREAFALASAQARRLKGAR